MIQSNRVRHTFFLPCVPVIACPVKSLLTFPWLHNLLAAVRAFPGNIELQIYLNVCIVGGSGSAYIYGLCDRHWKAGMSESDCKAFVQKAVSHAMARDGSSGGCIRTVCISKDGVQRDFVPGHSVPGHYGELPRPQPSGITAS